MMKIGLPILLIQKKEVDTFKETLLNHKNPTEDSLFYAICYTSKQQKNRKRICVLTVI